VLSKLQKYEWFLSAIPHKSVRAANRAKYQVSKRTVLPAPKIYLSPNMSNIGRNKAKKAKLN
jgi:hypothetical protein